MSNYSKVLFFTFIVGISGCACFGENNKPEIAFGDITAQQLLLTYSGFNEEYKAFSLSKTDADLVMSWPENLRVEIFFGTWCHDSVREVPRLLKALDNKVAIKLIALDYLKSEPLGRAMEADVKFTPTFIIYLDNKVIGKIVERPNVSLVEDINSFIEKEAG